LKDNFDLYSTGPTIDSLRHSKSSAPLKMMSGGSSGGGGGSQEPVKKKRIAFTTIAPDQPISTKTSTAGGSTSMSGGFASMDGRMGGTSGASLNSQGLPGMPGMGPSVGSEKPNKKPTADQLPCENKTFRIKLSLEHRAEDKNFFNQFNWLDLVADTEDRLNPKKPGQPSPSKKQHPSANGPLDPYASDDEDQLKAMAAKFEAKYATAKDKVKKKKKERKLDDYADLGYGYDSDDPFIDNSDVHDEIVPETLAPAHGGFYVNCGKLEFKARDSAEENSDLEAVIQEGEKAAAMQKRKYKKRKGDGASGNSSSGPQQQQSSGKTKQVPKQKPRPRKQPTQTSSDINSVNIKSPNRENNKSNVPDTPPTTPRSPLRCATNTIPTTTITLS